MLLGIVAFFPVAASAFAPAAPASSALRLVLPVVSVAYEVAPGPRVRHHDEGLFGVPFSAAFAPTLTVTKTDAIIGDDGDGLADPGETIRYTIEIGNSGPDGATGVMFDDTFDPNTTFVTDSDNASPIAFDGDEVAMPGATITITLVGSDADGDDLTFAIESGPSDGSLGAIMGNGSGQTATVEYTANNPSSGASDSFTFSVTDNSGFSNAMSNENATVTITLDAAPEVDTVDPADNATGVAVDTDITITFTEDVNLAMGAVTLECPTGNTIAFTNTTGSGPATTFTIDPDADLPSNETCTLTVLAANVTDNDTTDPPDNMAADFTSTFTTDAAPTVVSTTPADNATDVPVDSNIDITFSEDVSISSGPAAFDIDCTASGNHTFTVSSSAAASKTQVTMYTLNPDTDFVLSEQCTVTLVADEITDDDGGDPPDTLDGDGDGESEGSTTDDYVFTFTTPDAPPTVTMTELEVGDVFGTATTNIDPDTDIRFTFSEDVNFGGSAFSVVCGTSGTVTGDYTASATPASTVTLAYSGGGLAGGETCTVTLESTAVTDDDAADPPDDLDGDGSNDSTDGDADD
ncbi:MAG TPA: Ig-like domain-containing protein, partial [Rhodothermales bacterium]|nr:Ig-like domain-containing protein [Rhodothermales bacterium]